LSPTPSLLPETKQTARCQRRLAGIPSEDLQREEPHTAGKSGNPHGNESG
jgi:hypothetical protein